MGVLLKGIVLFTAAARREAIDESELRICLSVKRGAAMQRQWRCNFFAIV